MAKRFTDTFKWQRPWYRNLPPKYRELWNYILDMCDHAGIWYVDIQMAGLVLNYSDLDLDEAKRLYDKQVRVIDASRWFIPDFIPFQYGHLTESHFHSAIKETLRKFKLQLPKGYGIPYQKGTLGTRKEKERVKDKEGVKEVDVKKLHEWFEKIWLAYPLERRHGKPTAFNRFSKSVVDLEAAKRCARALERYLKSDTVKRGYLMRASKWFDEWEDHADAINESRDSQGIRGERVETGAKNEGARTGGFVASHDVLRSTTNLPPPRDTAAGSEPDKSGN